MVGRIREIVFDEGVDVDGIATEAASEAYVDAKFDPIIQAYSGGIYLDNTSGLPTLSPWRSGVIAWDTHNKCMAYSTEYEGGWLQLGEEIQDDGVNKTGSTLSNGTVVYIDGAQGNRPKLYRANASDLANSQKTIGLVTADAGIAINAEGPYTTSGVVRNLNTNTFSEGDLLWLSTTDGQYTATKPTNQYRHIMIGIVVKAHLTQGEIYVNVRDLTDQFALAGYHIVDPHGFTEYDDTYAQLTQTGNLTINLVKGSNNIPYFFKGEYKEIAATKSITLSATDGMHYIGYNPSTDALEDLGSSFPIVQALSTHIITAAAHVYSGVINYWANERHSTKFPKRLWAYLHKYEYTRYDNGIGPSVTSIDGNGSSADHARFSVSSGIIADEDIPIAIGAKVSTDTIKVWYRDSSLKWTNQDGIEGSGVLNGGGRAYYNPKTTGGLTAISANNDYVLAHLFALNSGNLAVIMGQVEYVSIAAARIGANTELTNLVTAGLPFTEFRAIATFIYKTNDTYGNNANAVIVTGDNGAAFSDWRTTSNIAIAGSSASTHNSLSGLQGGTAGEYYHLDLSLYNRALNNVFPSGQSTNSVNKIYLPTNTTSGWNALTASESLIGWDSTKKKPIIGDGSVFKPIGGGLVPTPIDKDYATALETGKHYVYNGAGMTGNVTLSVQAIAAESNFKVTVYNIPSGYKLILDANGSETFRKDDTSYTTIEFVATEIEQAAEFVSNNTEWIVDDGSNALGTVWSGALTVTGPFTPQGGIVGKTDGIAVASGYVGQNSSISASDVTVTSTSSFSDFSTNWVSPSLTSGNYMIIASGSFQLGATPPSSGDTTITDSFRIVDSNDNVICSTSNNTIRYFQGTGEVGFSSLKGSFCMFGFLNFSGPNRTVKVQGKCIVVGGITSPSLYLGLGNLMIVRMS